MAKAQLCINGGGKLQRCIYFPLCIQGERGGAPSWYACPWNRNSRLVGNTNSPTIVFVIPMVATLGKENRPTENLQLELDIRVPLRYEDLLNGKDVQLEAAIREMMKKIQ